ncbi:MAG: hypothetical protein LBT79_07580 [Elusimicrobiota bacterium]|jgi:DNA-binding phage protein|nr:hypothetical protein [Elusimicrobiota bacterium]
MKTEDIDKTDCRIDEEDYDITFAKIISENPKKLQAFKKHITQKYNETKNLPIFLEDLKILAIAQGNIAALARKINMKRPNVYRFLSKESNPTFANLITLTNNLGIDFTAHAKD